MKRIIAVFLAIVFVCPSMSMASQASYVIADSNGATFRAAINTSLQALASNNSGASEPSSTYANMWWYDTSTSILKKRDNANSAWANVAYNSGTGWVPYYSGTQMGDASTLTKDTDGTLAANSDSRVATQKATKTAVDAVATTAGGKLSKTTAGEISAMSEKTTPISNDLLLIEDSASSNAKKKVKIGNLPPAIPVSTAGDYPVSPFAVGNYGASDATLSTSYIKVAEIYVGRTGTLRVKFGLSAQTTGGHDVYGRIYRNGAAVGTEQTTQSTTVTVFSEDIAGWVPGDLLQLYIKSPDGFGVRGGAVRLFEGTPLGSLASPSDYPSVTEYRGNGAPVSGLGAHGDRYTRIDGTTSTTLYVNVSGTWIAK